MIAQKGVLGSNYKGPYDESVFERNKEVDEWLMGSGESDATVGSNHDKEKAGVVIDKLRNSSVASKKQAELERPV